MLLSLSDLSLFGLLAPARIVSLVLVLAAAYLGGSTAGAAAGVAFGAAMDLCVGYGALFTCCYGLCALVSGLFRDNGRGWFAVCALLSGLCAAMLGVDHALFVPLILELICAVAAFAALPPMVWDAVRHSLLPDTLMGESARRNVRRTAGKCATEAAQAFYELYLAMLNGVSEGGRRATTTCAWCSTARATACASTVCCAHQCWQRDYVTTLAAFNDVTQPMLKRGRAELTDFPYHFASRCVHLPELMRAINSALFALRERQSLRRQQEENQSLLARQYAGITDILRQLGAEVTQDVTAQPMMERQVRRYASAFGWIDNVCAVRDAQGRLVIELYGEGIDDVLQQGEGFSAGLSALLGVGLTRPKKVEEGDTVHLEMREPRALPRGRGHRAAAEGGLDGLGGHGMLFSDRRGCGLSAARGRHGHGRCRLAGQPPAGHLARALPARGHHDCGRAAGGLARPAAALGRHAVHHAGRPDPRPVHRQGGEPQVRRCALLSAHRRAVDHPVRQGAAHRPGGGGSAGRAGAAAVRARGPVHHAVGRDLGRHGGRLGARAAGSRMRATAPRSWPRGSVTEAKAAATTTTAPRSSWRIEKL